MYSVEVHLLSSRANISIYYTIRHTTALILLLFNEQKNVLV